MADRPTRGNVSFATIEAPADGKITEEQADLLKSGISLIVEVPWPADPKCFVGLHVISRQDMLESYAQARLEARMFTQAEVAQEQRKGPPEPPDALLVEKCFRDQVIQRAFCWKPAKRGEEPEPLFSSVEDLRIKVADNHVEELWGMYTNHEKWTAPLQNAEIAGNKELFEELVNRLKKSEGDGTLLAALPLPALAGLVLHLVSRLPD